MLKEMLRSTTKAVLGLADKTQPETPQIERPNAGALKPSPVPKDLSSLKANALNTFVADNFVDSVIEFGCGDGADLTKANYSHYTGVDDDAQAIKSCRKRFAYKRDKVFVTTDGFEDQTADLTLSLDVIPQITSQRAFHKHMRTLFNASDEFVGIFVDPNEAQSKTSSKRDFDLWIQKHRSSWSLLRTIDLEARDEFRFDDPTGPAIHIYFRPFDGQ